ncbi:hypothetical protein QTO02_10085 [Vibrio fortis]
MEYRSNFFTKQDLFGEAVGILETSKDALMIHEHKPSGVLTQINGGLKSKVQEDVLWTSKYHRKCQSSTSRGISFLLTFSEYKSLFRRKSCTYTGVPLNFDDPSSPNYPT